MRKHKESKEVSQVPRVIDWIWGNSFSDEVSPNLAALPRLGTQSLC